MPTLELFALLLGIGHTPVLKPAPIEATLTVRNASFCWARPHGNLPERMPAAAIHLRLDLQVSYRNPGQIPLVVPRTHEGTPYIGLSRGQLSKVSHAVNIFAPRIMRTLSNTNEEEFDSRFAVLPPGGWMSPMLAEEVELTIYNPSDVHGKDWRGNAMFVSIEETQQPVSVRVIEETGGHGKLWTGTVRTSTVEVRIPDSPAVSGDCH